LAKIAVAIERALAERRAAGTPGTTNARIVARGNGWTVGDVVCTSGPSDCSFEERHTDYSIAIVLAGSFQYRSPLGGALMAPGSLMLGNHGQCFECGHEHGAGDRCVSFWYAPAYFERIVADAGTRGTRLDFTAPSLPALRSLAPLVARAAAGVTGADLSWEELAIQLAATVVNTAAGRRADLNTAPQNALARVTRAVRDIDQHPAREHTIASLARHAGLSPFHFLRTFERLTGVTPHQYILRARLRHAATRLLTDRTRVLDVALDCGFGDVSNFNRAFRSEFGASPRRFRTRGAV
jgi:AraC family transcriptional regulator